MALQNDDMATAGIEYPRPTTKPAGKGFSVTSIVLALVSLLLGGLILGAAALGLGIRAKLLGQSYAVAALVVSGLALAANLAAMVLLEF